MVRAVWWVLAAAAVLVTVWSAHSLTMFDMSTACSKIGESSFYRCGDRAVDVLGVWPLVGVGAVLAAPPAAAAVAMRKSVSWFAVAALAALFVVGVLRITHDSYSNQFLFALPLAVVGAITAAFQTAGPRR